VSLYDHYRPFDIACPDCGQVITGWRGRRGPNRLLVWQQDSPHPIDHDVDPDMKLPPDEWLRFQLPEAFVIEAEHGTGVVMATGVAEGGTWRRTYLHYADDYGCPGLTEIAGGGPSRWRGSPARISRSSLRRR
jgi:hypothetical protein